MRVTALPADPRAACFFCGCGAAFSTPEEAIACGNTEPDFVAPKPGDILVWRSGYSWIGAGPGSTVDPLHRAWVLPEMRASSRGDAYDIIVVVTAVAPAPGSSQSRPEPFHKSGHNDVNRNVIHLVAGAHGIVADPDAFDDRIGPVPRRLRHVWTHPVTHCRLHPLPEGFVVPDSVIAEAKPYVDARAVTSHLL